MAKKTYLATSQIEGLRKLGDVIKGGDKAVLDDEVASLLVAGGSLVEPETDDLPTKDQPAK